MDRKGKNIVVTSHEPLLIDLVHPNAETLEGVVKKANGENVAPGVKSAVGTLIDPGKVGIVEWNGKVFLVGPGRWLFPNPRVTLSKVVTLVNPNPIVHESLTIVRVQRGEYGLAFENGLPQLLSEGIHVQNNRFFEFRQFARVDQQYLQHGSIHLIRVPQGHYALVTDNNVPKILPEGIHVTNTNVFSYNGLQSVNQEHIHHGTIHIVRVPKGKVALVNDNNHPRLLPEGTHKINSSTFNFHRIEDLNQECIKNGTITRFRVRKGEIGLAWENNTPEFFEEGFYEKDSPNFTFERCVSVSDKQISLGSKKIITVYDGEVGVSYKDGKLKVLEPARHLIDSAEWIFSGFMSTQQQCLSLVEGHRNKNQQQQQNVKGRREAVSSDEYLICETKDFVEIGIKADVFFKIADAETALLVVGKDNIEALVRETSIASLNSIIRSTSLSEVAQTKEIHAISELQHQRGAQTGGPTAPLFFEKVHDEFISKLHDSFMTNYGIDIRNIRIESFKIVDQDLATSISKQALLTSQVQSQLANLTGQTEIATAQSQRDADLARIKAEGDAKQLKTQTDAKNRATMETAKAESEATLLRAEAEAKAMQMRAQVEAKTLEMRAEAEAKALELKSTAEANAIKKRAAAEAERAQLLSASPVGAQLALFQMQTDMVKNAMQGVEKIVYLPSDAATNPFSFFQGGMVLPNINNMVAQPKK